MPRPRSQAPSSEEHFINLNMAGMVGSRYGDENIIDISLFSVETVAP
jgi:hypothetical protein